MNRFSDDIFCPHFDLCSGCVLNTGVNSPAIFDSAKLFFSEKKLSSFPLYYGSPTGWRCRAKLAVRGTSQYPQIGLYKEGSHDVVNIPFCKVHHSQINKAVDVVKQWIADENIPIYDEVSGVGFLRYIQLVVQRATGKVQLSLVVNETNLNSKQQESLKRLWDSSGLWHSIWINFNTTRHNVIFGSAWMLLDGEPLLWEMLGDLSVCFQPSSFAQANLDMFEMLLKRLETKIPANQLVVDLYAGVGVIGLYLTKKSQKVICCEINPSSEACFNESKQKLETEIAQKITFHVGTSSSFLKQITLCDVIVVDPPRKGLEKTVLKLLQSIKTPKQLYYISCGWNSFKQDCNTLLDAGWRLREAEGYLFFPGSEHIEILAVFGSFGK